MSYDNKLIRRRIRHKQNKINAQLKKNLFGHLFMSSCYYCKFVFLIDKLTIEHIIPLCLGGSNDPINIVLACAPCNQMRGREAWFHKRKLNKENYEQYSSQYRNENRQTTIQNS